MNSESVKRIVALQRQIKSYGAMVRQSLLTEAEAELMVADCNREIAAIRAQRELIGGAPAPAPAASRKA